jgi:hypothetical protein
VRDIATRWLDWKTLGPLVERYQSLIATDVAADTRKLYPTEQFRGGVSGPEASLRSFVESRGEYLLRR